MLNPFEPSQRVGRRGLLLALTCFLSACSASHEPRREAEQTPPPSQSVVKLSSEFQAVLLTNGQVLIGKLEGLGTPYPVLTDVYYVQTAVDAKTKQPKNLLVKRGMEWHAPDRTLINANHIVMVEPVGADSTVAKLIAEQKRQQ
jgi:hypothetical protein